MIISNAIIKALSSAVYIEELPGSLICLDVEPFVTAAATFGE